MATECHAVLFVYDAAKDDHVNELEEMYNKWIDIFGLGPSRYLVVARKWGEGQPSNKRIIKMGKEHVSLTIHPIPLKLWYN